MHIRKATTMDMPAIQAIYARARAYMRQTGNPNQWKDNAPAQSLIDRYIAQGVLMVAEDQGLLQAVFALIPGPDPTYSYIEGKWLNDAPYAAIHSVASAGLMPGMLGVCLAYADTLYDNLRIDTHHDNLVMQHLLDKHGFTRCGIIYLENGDPRIAYHKVKTC